MQQLGEKIKLKIEKIAQGGRGIGRYNNLVVFVKDTCPGDLVKIKITEVKKNYLCGDLLAVIKPSPFRVLPECPLFYECGGCVFQHIDYKFQKEIKRQILKDSLRKLKISPDICLSTDEPWNYRSKMQMALEKDKFGLYMEKSHKIVPLGNCLIQSLSNNLILNEFQKFLRKKTLPEIKYLISRVNSKGEILLVLVSQEKYLKEEEDLIGFLKNIPKLQGVILNYNPHIGNVILGKNNYLILGKNYLEEEIDALKYRIYETAFFQTNLEALKIIFSLIRKWIGIRKFKLIVDAYSGVGTFALMLSKYAHKIIGIEEEPQAAKSSKINQEINKLNNLEFINGKVEEHLSEILKNSKPDLIILDPPRKGVSREILELIKKNNLQEIFYISCNPATLSRDLEFLTNCGTRKNQTGGGRYKIKKVVPVDMFPQTAHIECIARISKF
ncbi:MAG: 23S rRNA (uracil(1939)-C(5))-methyltransferase RlmD [Armatimonadetes bacterium]|nr:23S rRNA (uracil(1939)-C(5))-methyltransferase RlmD [Armatimonadota bacterium]